MKALNQVTLQQHLGMTSSLSKKNDSQAKNSIPCPRLEHGITCTFFYLWQAVYDRDMHAIEIKQRVTHRRWSRKQQ